MHPKSGLSRRSVLASGAGLAAAGALSACGGSAKGVLNVWGGVPPESGPDDVIAAFERKFPNVTVEYHRYVNDPQGNVQLDTALQGGAPIDVYFTYGVDYVTQRVNAELAVDLTDRVRSDDAFATLADPDTPRAVWFDGKLFSLPTARDLWVVFANEKMLEQAGLSLPETWTTEDYDEAARALSGGSAYGMYSYPDTARIELGPNYMYRDGGTASNFNHPAFRENAQAFRDALEEESAFPYAEVVAQKMDTYQHAAFLQGRFALWPASIFNTRYIADTEEFPRDFKVSLSPLPRIPGADYWNTGLISNDVMISPNSPNQDAAWDFVRFYMTEGADLMIRSGRIPMLLDQFDEEQLMAGLLGPNPDRLFDVESARRVILAEDTKYPLDTITTGYTEIRTSYLETRQSMLLGEMSVDEWVTTMNDRAEEAIAESI